MDQKNINEKRIENLIRDYLKGNTIFIVDPSGVSRARLSGILNDLGAMPTKIKTYGSFEQAEHYYKELKPKIVLSDYKIGTRSGLDLFESMLAMKEVSPEDSLFIMITSNSSQSVVARAAEEDVDAFILKPYSIQTIKKIFVKTALDKLFPSEYMQVIAKGKNYIRSGEYEQALKIFDSAKELSESPTLACFYHGQAMYMMDAVDNATSSYKSGLEYNKIHYKCLVGLFDLMMEQNLHEEAYDIVRKIAEYFPANPKRLAQIIHLAITTQNYSDIEEYYNFFVEFNYRTDELINYVCSSLLICGKYYLQNNYRDRAFSLFEKASITAQGHTKFLRILIEYLTEFKQHDHYASYIRRFDNDSFNSKDFKIADFLTKHLKMKPVKIVKQCNDFIREGIHSSSLHYLLIENNKKLGRVEDAEDAFKEAVQKWPEKSSTFFRVRSE